MNDDDLKNNPEEETDFPSSPPESDVEAGSTPVQTHDEVEESQHDTEDSADDDPFAEIRRGLKQDEATEKEKKEKSFVGRITGRFKRPKLVSVEKPVDTEEESINENVSAELTSGSGDSPSDEKIASLMGSADPSESEPAEEKVASLAPDQNVEDFILNLEPPEVSPEIVQKEEPEEPAQEEQIEELVKSTEVLKPAAPQQIANDQRDETMREVALEDYGTEREVEETQTQTLSQRVKVIRRGLKPIERLLIFGGASLFIIICLVAGGAFLYPRFSEGDSAPSVPTQDLPYPVRLTLAGSGYFELDRGVVENGKWNLRNKSQGTGEWLEGTELCKWVAIPWNVQLEAVVRSLTPKDTIDLTMSNADILTYNVYSIKNIPVDQIDSLERAGTCLLVILANEDADTRWVVTALP